MKSPCRQQISEQIFEPLRATSWQIDHSLQPPVTLIMARQGRLVVPPVDDEVMALGLREIASSIAALRRSFPSEAAQGCAQIGGILLTQAHKVRVIC